MPPKRKQEASESDAPPRRSTRVTAKKEEPPKPAAPAKKPKAAKAEKPSSKGKKKKGEDAGEESKEEAEASEPTKSAIKVGETIPDLTVSDDKGQEVSLHSLVKSNGVVFFFYPKANTPGCTKQACGFRDSYAEFEKAGYVPVGVSGDTVNAQSSWKTKEKLTFSLLSDPDHAIVKALGASKGASSIARGHVVVGKGGVVEDVKFPASPSDSYEGALEFVTKK